MLPLNTPRALPSRMLRYSSTLVHDRATWSVLVDRHRPEVERPLGLPLHLVVFERGARSDDDLRDAVREGDLGGPARVRLDDGRLAVGAEQEQVPRVGDDRQIFRGREEEEMDRFVHDALPISTSAPS